VISTALLFGIALVALVYVVLFVSSPVVSSAVFKSDRYSPYFRLAFVTLSSDIVGELALSYIARSNNHSGDALSRWYASRFGLSLKRCTSSRGCGWGCSAPVQRAHRERHRHVSVLIATTLREVSVHFSGRGWAPCCAWPFR